MRYVSLRAPKLYMKPDVVSASPMWQTIFLICAALLILLEVFRGWRLGLPRQLVRIGAIVLAYASAIHGGQHLLPILRPLITLPDIVLSAIGGAILALVVYLAVTSIGTILFKRTGQQQSGLVRVVYGLTGAVVGLFFGAFLLWLLVVGIRSLGAIAEAQVNASAPRALPPLVERPERDTAPLPRRAPRPLEPDVITGSLARLKKSIELGSVGDVVKQTDVLPTGVYDTLTKVGTVFAQPERAQRFLSYPGVAELTDHPKLLALRADPEINRMIEQGRLLELIRDERLIEAANDPDLAAQVKKFDFRAALDHALEER